MCRRDMLPTVLHQESYSLNLGSMKHAFERVDFKVVYLPDRSLVTAISLLYPAQSHHTSLSSHINQLMLDGQDD